MLNVIRSDNDSRKIEPMARRLKDIPVGFGIIPEEVASGAKTLFTSRGRFVAAYFMVMSGREKSSRGLEIGPPVCLWQ